MFYSRKRLLNLVRCLIAGIILAFIWLLWLTQPGLADEPDAAQPDKPITAEAPPVEIWPQVDQYGPWPYDAKPDLMPLPDRGDQDPIRSGVSNNDRQKIQGGESPDCLRDLIDIGPIEKPAVISRTDWGCPDGQDSPRRPPQYNTEVTHVIVHQAETPNDMAPYQDYAGWVRSIWDYHANVLGWGDVGYNYLIDPNGVIYEGRAGDDNVIGVHDTHNEHSLSIGLIGCYDNCDERSLSVAEPSEAMLDSTAKLIAWKLEQQGIDPLSSAQYDDLPNISVIAGGRDVVITSSPGDNIYNKLPDIPARIEDIRARLEEEALNALVAAYAKKFAPVLKFDKAAKTFPMDAQKYFEEMLCGDQGGPPCLLQEGCTKSEDYNPERDGCDRHDVSWGNNSIRNIVNGNENFSTLAAHGYQIPTYYKLRCCGTSGQLRIEYWWFYGWQPDADHGCRQHHPADWEHIVVTTSQNKQGIAAITYYQHSGWYTKIHGRSGLNRYLLNGHPVVYVGKTAHGSYHDGGGSGTCTYYEDWRNPSSNTVWNTWETPLINLDGNEQDWLNYPSATWAWGYHYDWHYDHTPADYHNHVGWKTPTTSTEPCTMRACEGRAGDWKTVGCWFGKSDCKPGHCWCGDSRCAHDCYSCVFWEEYQKNFTLPTSDSGLY